MLMRRSWAVPVIIAVAVFRPSRWNISIKMIPELLRPHTHPHRQSSRDIVCCQNQEQEEQKGRVESKSLNTGPSLSQVQRAWCGVGSEFCVNEFKLTIWTRVMGKREKLVSVGEKRWEWREDHHSEKDGKAQGNFLSTDQVNRRKIEIDFNWMIGLGLFRKHSWEMQWTKYNWWWWRRTGQFIQTIHVTEKLQKNEKGSQVRHNVVNICRGIKSV